jgi:hypothetical protein
MGSCPTCGKKFFLNSDFNECGWCGKSFCKDCLPEWYSQINVKEESKQDSTYTVIGFCSEVCDQAFGDALSTYPVKDVGTDINAFPQNIRKMYYDAILLTLNSNPKLRERSILKVVKAIDNETEENSAILMGLEDDGSLFGDYIFAHEFVRRGYEALAENLEKSGRYLDSAKVYETKLKQYDEAKRLRDFVRSKQVVVKHTNISMNINDLLKQIRDSSLVAAYRCPQCNSTLKIDNQTKADSLRTCEYCGAKLRAFDIEEFLKAVLP